MSGGSFDYACYKVHQFADDLKLKIQENKNPNEWGHTYNFSEDTIMELTKIAHQAEKFAQIMREVEWLYSADIGEDTMLQRIREIRNGR